MGLLSYLLQYESAWIIQPYDILIYISHTLCANSHDFMCVNDPQTIIKKNSFSVRDAILRIE